MNYSIAFLTEVADCNALLSWATREKADLDYKKTGDERLTSRYAETSLEVEADLQSVVAELSGVETMIAVLPEGPARDEAVIRKTRLEYRKFTLETRKASFGTVALLEKENDLARVIQEIDEVTAFSEAVQARKAEIQAQA